MDFGSRFSSGRKTSRVILAKARFQKNSLLGGRMRAFSKIKFGDEFRKYCSRTYFVFRQKRFGGRQELVLFLSKCKRKLHRVLIEAGLEEIRLRITLSNSSDLIFRGTRAICFASFFGNGFFNHSNLTRRIKHLRHFFCFPSIETRFTRGPVQVASLLLLKTDLPPDRT